MIDFTRLEEVRQRRPLIHCVSNIVPAGDCANLALAVGASPMMAHAPEEMADITAIWHNIESVMIEEMNQTPPQWPMILT